MSHTIKFVVKDYHNTYWRSEGSFMAIRRVGDGYEAWVITHMAPNKYQITDLAWETKGCTQITQQEFLGIAQDAINQLQKLIAECSEE